MTLRIRLTEPRAATRAMDAVRARGKSAEHPLLTLSALVAERELKLELSRPGTGRLRDPAREVAFLADTGQNVFSEVRFQTGGKRSDRASAPGEPPAVDTGQLRNSVTHVVEGDRAYVGTPLSYGRFLEFGFILPNGTQVAPRPWMRTVIARLPDLLGEELRGGVEIGGVNDG